MILKIYCSYFATVFCFSQLNLVFSILDARTTRCQTKRSWCIIASAKRRIPASWKWTSMYILPHGISLLKKYRILFHNHFFYLLVLICRWVFSDYDGRLTTCSDLIIIWLHHRLHHWLHCWLRHVNIL